MESKVFWGVYGSLGINIQNGRKYAFGEGLELKSRIPVERFNESTRKIEERSKEESEFKAREAGANVIVQRRGYYYLYHLKSDAKQIIETIASTSAKPETADEQNRMFSWGKHYFNEKGEAGKKFGIQLDGAERVIPLSNLEHLGTLAEYESDRGKMVARDVVEVEEHVRKTYGEDIIIVPSRERKKTKARLNFYKEVNPQQG